MPASPGGIEGAVPGRVQGGGRLRGGQRAAVGKGYPAAQGKRPGEPVLRHRVATAQQVLGLKAAVQLKEPLIDQPAQGQIGAVGAGKRVKPRLRITGQGKRRLLRLSRGKGRGRWGGRGRGLNPGRV